MQAVQAQRFQLAFCVERQRALELQCIWIVDPQTTQLEGAIVDIRAQAKLYRMVWQSGVKRSQQQLAAMQAAVQIEPGRAMGSVKIETTAPPLRLCTDNAVMVAWAAQERRRAQLGPDPLDAPCRPRWPLTSIDKAH